MTIFYASTVGVKWLALWVVHGIYWENVVPAYDVPV